MEEQLKTISGPAWKGVRYISTTRAIQDNESLQQLLPSAPHWLQQVHGTRLYHALQPAKKIALLPQSQAPIADAAWTNIPNTVIAVFTADCLPVVIADTKGMVVGVAHAGWRGLAAGVLEKLFFQLQQQAGSDAQWQAWIGPAISQKHYEVGQDVLDAFVQKSAALNSYFTPVFNSINKPNKYLADLVGLAANQLNGLAENSITISFSNACTYAEKNRYYSYRRQASTGRMATLAWLV